MLGPWDYSSRRNLIVAVVSFLVRYGAPQVRSLRKIRVNLYRRTPLWSPVIVPPPSPLRLVPCVSVAAGMQLSLFSASLPPSSPRVQLCASTFRQNIPTGAGVSLAVISVSLVPRPARVGEKTTQYGPVSVTNCSR